MSTKEDNNQITHHQSVDILDSESHDRSSEGQIANNNGDDDKTAKKKSNPYKQFDAKTRRKVFMWLQLVTFLVASVTCVASFTVPALRKSRPRGIAMWQWSMLASVLLVGPILSKLVVNLVLLVNDREFPATKENILYYVVELAESAWVVLWFSMILIAWLIVVNEPDYLGMPSDKSEKIVKKFNTTWPIINITLITFILGSFLWLIKKLVLMWTKSSFHIKRFFVRIREALRYQSVVEALFALDALSKPADKPADHVKEQTAAMVYWNCFQEIHVKNCLDKMKKKNYDLQASCLDDVNRDEVSCWGMKKVIDWIINHKTLNCKKDDDDNKNIDVEKEANTDAKNLFSSCADSDEQAQGPKWITWEGLEKKLSDLLPEKASFPKVKECLFGGDAAKKIEEKDFKKWMVKVYKHRESLVNALVANKRLFRTFNRFINALLVLFIFALWLIMIRVETRNVIIFIGSALVGAAVFCGDSCRKILENLQFVFVVHAYDIGDYCLIDDTLVKIKAIYVLSTIAWTLDNEIRHYPNSVLANKVISNYTRSVDMADVIEFVINGNKTKQIIGKLEANIERYFEEKKQILKSDHKWVKEPQEGKTKVKLHFHHTIEVDDIDERKNIKSDLYMKIREIIDEENEEVTSCCCN